MLFFVVGEVGAGKSVIAARAGEQLSLPVYEIDALKKSVYESFPDYDSYRLASTLVPDSYRVALYQNFLQYLLRYSHQHAIVVENFYTIPPRQVLYEAADKFFGGYKVIWITAAPAILAQRLQALRPGHDLPQAWEVNQRLSVQFQGIPEADLILENNDTLTASAQALADFLRAYL